MNLLNFLELWKEKYNIQYCYTTAHYTMEFHIFKNDLEIASGLQVFTDKLYITLYTDFDVYLDEYDILHNSYYRPKNQASSSYMYNINTELVTVCDMLNKHIQGNSTFQQNILNKKSLGDKIYKQICMLNDNDENKKKYIIKRYLSLEKDFE